MSTNRLDISLFDSSRHEGIAANIGVGFHNIGSGILRASHSSMIRKVEAHYGERCGHIPLQANHVRILTTTHNCAIESQVAYLSALFGKQIKTVTASELRQEQENAGDPSTLVVPYINTHQSEEQIQTELAATSWGLPGKMVTILKNKADFYGLLDDYDLPNFQTPDYQIAPITDLNRAALNFLRTIEEIISQAGLAHYPLGIMLRAAESDGNYGSCLIYKQRGAIALVPNGDADNIQYYSTWKDAINAAQQILLATMDITKEIRIVMSRYIDFIDSPGMSVVIMNGQIETLRWNGQLQEPGSKACVGTGNYQPKIAAIACMQHRYEDQTLACFEQLLRQTAQKYKLDFSTLRGVANIDIMLPSPLEEQLQKQRGQPPALYIAECNPRWTNYTDAILTILGANRLVPSINAMRATIQNRLQAFDKYKLPDTLDPCILRERIAEKDERLKASGTRIICRMAQSPLGVILTGDLELAKKELKNIIHASYE